MKVPIMNVEVNDVTVKMMIDTGASTDIIDEPTYQLIKQATPLTVEPDSFQILAYGSKSQLEALGKCTIKVKAKKQTESHNLPHTQWGTWVTSHLHYCQRPGVGQC